MADQSAAWAIIKPAGTDYLDASDELIRDNWDAIEEFARGETINLVITRPTAATVRVYADRLVLLKDDGAAAALPPAFIVTSVDVTIDITAAGANGLDAGAEGASDWYTIWVIRDTTNSLTRGLLSITFDVATGPTMPANYTYRRLVGAVYNDASSNFVNFTQRGKRVQYAASQQILTNGISDAAWAALVSLAAFVPDRFAADKPMASRMFGYADIDSLTAATGLTLEFAADASGNYRGTKLTHYASGAAWINGGHFEQELLAASPMSFSYRTTDTAGLIRANAYLQGYEIEI